MDSIIGLKEEIKKLFLVYFIPGAMAAWPWIFVIVKWFNSHPFVNHELLKDYATTVYIITLLFFYGSGHIIAKIGSRIEVLMEKMIYKYIKVGSWYKFIRNKNDFRSLKSKEMKETHENFTDVWYRYLKSEYSKAEAPLFIRYYSEFIVGLKFELNNLAALPIMIISLYYLEKNHFINTMTYCNLLTLAFVCFGIWTYLLYEAFNGIKVAHELREKIITK
jgi:hypothetical protein